MGEFGNFLYSHNNGEYVFGVDRDIIARGKTLQELIDDVVSKKWLFDQKDKLKNINLGTMEEYYFSPSQKMQYIVSKYDIYSYLVNFWLGKNNASAGFNGPSAGYGLSMMDTFQYSENEASVRILMKLMADNGNKWTISKDKVNKTIKDNLVKCGAITIDDGIVSFTEDAIKKIENRYNEQKEGALSSIKRTEQFFEENNISMPEL